MRTFRQNMAKPTGQKNNEHSEVTIRINQWNTLSDWVHASRIAFGIGSSPCQPSLGFWRSRISHHCCKDKHSQLSVSPSWKETFHVDYLEGLLAWVLQTCPTCTKILFHCNFFNRLDGVTRELARKKIEQQQPMHDPCFALPNTAECQTETAS